MHKSIPTPTISVLEFGQFTVHAYALCIIAGVALAIWLGGRRFVAAFPDTSGVVGDVAIIAVPAGVLGGRLYHVITTPERFFGAAGRPHRASAARLGARSRRDPWHCARSRRARQPRCRACGRLRFRVRPCARAASRSPARARPLFRPQRRPIPRSGS